MPWLVALDGELRGRRFPLGAQCLIGRGYHNHVVLDDARASRQHARISPDGPSWVLHDLKSANGTFVNGARIERHELRPNDLLRVGGVQFRFEGDPAEMPLTALRSPSGQFRMATTAIGADKVFAPLEPPKSDFANARARHAKTSHANVPPGPEDPSATTTAIVC